MVKTKQNNTNKLVNRIIKSINEDLSDMFDDDIEDDFRLTDEDEILYHFGDEAAEDMEYDSYDCDDDNSVNESVENPFYDEEGNWDPIDDDDYENPFYDEEGNWDPIDDEDDDFSNSDIRYICDIVGQFQYIDFNDMNGPIHLNNENIDIESIENQGEDADDGDIEIVDTNGDIYDIEDFDADDIATLAQAVGEYSELMGDDY